MLLLILILFALQKLLLGTTIVYDTFTKPGGDYNLTDYSKKWVNLFGLGDIALNDTRRFHDGTFSVSSIPYKLTADNVYDVLKYVAYSKESFPVPSIGSISFASNIDVKTSGIQPGKIIHGTYTKRPGNPPYVSQPLFESQQAAAVMNVVNFYSGQIFDIFVSSHSALAWYERLPSSLTGSPLNVSVSKIFSQIVKEIPISPGPHAIEITYTRYSDTSTVQYFIDGVEFAKVVDVGVPLNIQNVPYTGLYPSVGPGEKLVNLIDSFVFGHGLLSLVAPFPFNYPAIPSLYVSIPASERIFGQGTAAKYRDFTVTTNNFPTSAPIVSPTSKPSIKPTSAPTKPSAAPSAIPSKPSPSPTAVPTKSPSHSPSVKPTLRPTAAPSYRPSSLTPTKPTSTPSTAPTKPSLRPSAAPTEPSASPTHLKLCLFATGCFLHGVDQCQAGTYCHQYQGYSQCVEQVDKLKSPPCTSINNFGCQTGGHACCNPSASCASNGVCSFGPCSFSGYYK